MKTYIIKKQMTEYGAEHTIIKVFHFLMKYALTPVRTKETENKIHITVPAAGRYFGPSNSPVTTYAPTTVPGLKRPTMKRQMANIAKFGENALRKLTRMIPQTETTNTLKRPYLKMNNNE